MLLLMSLPSSAQVCVKHGSEGAICPASGMRDCVGNRLWDRGGSWGGGHDGGWAGAWGETGPPGIMPVLPGHAAWLGEKDEFLLPVL